VPAIILNELSFEAWGATNSGYPCRDRHHARQVMQGLIATLRETARFPGIRPELRTQYASLEYSLAEDYTVAHWRNDPDVNRDEQRFLRLRSTIAFSLEDELSADTISEVTWKGRKGFGLSATWLLNGICLSLTSHEDWNRSLLDAQVTVVSEDDVSEETVNLRHVSNPFHFNDHEEWLLRLQESLVHDGPAIIEQANISYPNIEFGLDARKEILALTGKEHHFNWVLECLESANRVIRAWKVGQFPHHHLPGPATGESGTVRDSKRLMKMRVFSSATGESLQFEYHMKDKSNNKRMYYRVETERQIILIGALCGHLETAKY
jgi:hypothetical protein